MPTLRKPKESQAHQVLFIYSNLHTSHLIPALEKLREELGYIVAFLHFYIPEFILERQLPLVALALEKVCQSFPHQEWRSFTMKAGHYVILDAFQ